MTCLKGIMVGGVAAFVVVAAVPEVQAADLGVTPSKSVRTVVHRARVVRDYDGTPVMERRVRRVVRGPDGAGVVSTQIEMIPLERADPSHYLNGQPVLPQRPLRTAIVVRARY